jgi:hypothetical protein
MEHAPLRPVPSRPAGPLDPATATRELEALLPQLPPQATRALGLVALAERPRAEAATLLSVEDDELAGMLASARKELRRTLTPLPGSGWCERAERLISDRLDGALAEADTRRLDVHLRNCPRCVEHERRLVQATDGLLASVASLARPGPAPVPPAAEPEPPAAGPEPPAEPQASGTEGEPPGAGPEPPPPGAGPEPPPPGAGPEPPPPAAAPEPPAEPRPSGTEGEPPAAAPEQPPPAAAPEPPAAAPGPPPAREVAAAAEVLVAARTRRQIAAAVTWNAMIAIAVLLTLATLALTVAGILGAEL